MQKKNKIPANKTSTKNNKAVVLPSGTETVGASDPNAATATQTTAGDSEVKTQGTGTNGEDAHRQEDPKVDTRDKKKAVRTKGHNPYAKSLKEKGVLYVTSDGFAFAKKEDALNYAIAKLQDQNVEEMRYEAK
jgi:hypothetical protein